MHTHYPFSTKLQMRFLSGDVFGLRQEIPVQYRSFLYPFSGAVLEESVSVDILHQVMQVNGFTICNHVFFAKEDTQITPYVEEPVSTLHCMLRGSIKCELNGVGALWLRAGQFGFFQVNNVQHRAWLKKDCIYESFHIDFSREQLEVLKSYSGVIQALLDKADKDMPAYIAPQAGIMFNRFYELINEIRNIHPAYKMREIEVPANISLLLAIALMDAEASVVAEDNEAVLFATIHAYILNNLFRELSNREIAREYSMSVSKLKYGYKRIYNEPIQTFVRRARLESAKELIGTTGFPLQRIAEMVGYMDYGNFSRMYRRFYGHPPSDVRRPPGNV